MAASAEEIVLIMNFISGNNLDFLMHIWKEQDIEQGSKLHLLITCEFECQ